MGPHNGQHPHSAQLPHHLNTKNRSPHDFIPSLRDGRFIVRPGDESPGYILSAATRRNTTAIFSQQLFSISC